MYSINNICQDVLLHIFSFLYNEKHTYFCSSSSYPYINMYAVQKYWYSLLKKKECIWSKNAFNNKVFCFCSFPYEYTFLTYFKTHRSWIENHYRKNYKSSLHPSSETRIYSFHNYVYNDKHKMNTVKIRAIFKDSNIKINHFCCDDTGFMFQLEHESDLGDHNYNSIEDKS